jgi:hypothetical protein
VKPSLPSCVSYEERKQAVRNFSASSYDNQVHIKSYHKLALFLDDQRIIPLCKLMKSEKESTVSDYGVLTEHHYTDADAEKYFEWLVAVVNETEKVTDSVKKQAHDQLFRILYVMKEDIERDKNLQLIAPYNWQNLFMSFDDRLTEIQRIIDKGDKDTIEVLKSLLQLVTENKKLLKTLYKDSEKIFGRK